MHAVLETTQLSPNVTRLVVEAPRIAEIRRPGQFVIVRRGPGAERIPLTIADVDPSARHDHAGHPGDRQEHRGPRRAGASATRSRTSPGRSAGRPSCSSTGARSASAAASARPSSTRSPGARSPRRAGHQHHRRALEGVGDLRGGAAARRRGRHLHRRRQLRPPRLRDRGAQGRARGGRRRRRLRRRPGADDARRRRADPAVRRADHRLAQPDHGRRHRACAAAAASRSAARPMFACVDGPEFDGHQVDFRHAGRPPDHLPRLRAGRRSDSWTPAPRARRSR